MVISPWDGPSRASGRMVTRSRIANCCGGGHGYFNVQASATFDYFHGAKPIPSSSDRLLVAGHTGDCQRWRLPQYTCLCPLAVFSEQIDARNTTIRLDYDGPQRQLSMDLRCRPPGRMVA